MARNLITLLAGFLLLLAEVVYVGLFSVDTWVPHLSVGVMLYLALRKGLFEACVAVLLLSWAADLGSAAPPGVTALSLTVTFFAVYISNRTLAYRGWLVRIVLSVVAVAFSLTVGAVLMVALTRELDILWALVFTGLPSALLAPVGMLVSWAALAWIDRTFAARQRGLLTSQSG